MPFVDLGDARLAYTLHGHGAPVLLIMGFGFPGVAWQAQVAGLSPHLQCCTYDHRGVGGSTGGDRPRGLDGLAEDARALLDHLGWDSAHLVGVSMGGMVAQHVAVQAPERVRSLTLMATHAGGKPGTTLPSLRAMKLFVKANLSRGTDRLAVLRHLLYPEGVEPQRPLTPEILEEVGRPAGRRVRLMQLWSILTHDTRDALEQLHDIPALVIRPGQDILVPPHHSDVLAERLPDVHVVRFDEAGHGVMGQCADGVNAAILEHVQQVEARRSQAS